MERKFLKGIEENGRYQLILTLYNFVFERSLANLQTPSEIILKGSSTFKIKAQSKPCQNVQVSY